MKILTIAIFCFSLFGCATSDYNYRPEVTKINIPSVNSVKTSYIGDEMIRQGRYLEFDAIFLGSEVEIGFSYDILPGYFIKKGEDNNTETYLPSGGPESGGVHKAAIADPWQSIMLYKDKNSICIITVFNFSRCSSAQNIKRTKKIFFTSDSFQRTLIYNGKVGDKINISYREFSNNLARPAYNNSVEYDLSTSHIIGYKGARLEVIKATNEQITFKMLQNFKSAR